MTTDFPRIQTLGLDTVLVSFGDKPSDETNRAALAFRSAAGQAGLPGIVEHTATLVSACFRVDPMVSDVRQLSGHLTELLETRDWSTAPLPDGRHLWRVPCVFGGSLAPQFDEAAELAGLSRDEALNDMRSTTVRVLMLGFSPGQPYLGLLPPAWDLPRQTDLTAQVPVGALVVAVRQMCLFSTAKPTGWRHIGQTAFAPFSPGAEPPFRLSPGDEMQFCEVSEAEFQKGPARDPSGLGGAERVAL